MMTLRNYLPPLLLLPLIGNGPATDLTLDLQGQRNHNGVLHICVSAQQRFFPDCSQDPAAIKRTLPAKARWIHLSNVAPGRYAITAFHDENRNGKLDTTLGIPREGFGFSRNPVVRFGAPKFRQVVIEIVPGLNRQTVQMKYLL